MMIRQLFHLKRTSKCKKSANDPFPVVKKILVEMSQSTCLKIEVQPFWSELYQV